MSSAPARHTCAWAKLYLVGNSSAAASTGPRASQPAILRSWPNAECFADEPALISYEDSANRTQQGFDFPSFFRVRSESGTDDAYY